jgi:hypothetical protein
MYNLVHIMIIASIVNETIRYSIQLLVLATTILHHLMLCHKIVIY